MRVGLTPPFIDHDLVAVTRCGPGRQQRVVEESGLSEIYRF